jgi:hypothetical protein
MTKAPKNSSPGGDPKDKDLKEALDNLKEAVELFCMAYSEARSATCPLGAQVVSLDALEKGIADEPVLLERHGLSGTREHLRRQWQGRLRIPLNRAPVEIDLPDHHGTPILARYAHRLAESSADYVRRITSHRWDPAHRRLIMPRPGGRIVVVTGEDSGLALELYTTAREDWQTGIIASYLKMTNPALLAEFTIG